MYACSEFESKVHLSLDVGRKCLPQQAQKIYDTVSPAGNRSENTDYFVWNIYGFSVKFIEIDLISMFRMSLSEKSI